MDKKEILDILDNAKDERGAVPMRLVRQAFDKLVQLEERKESLCKKVRALCEESKIEFFFVGGGESTWSVTNDKHIKKIVECHKAQLSQKGTTKDATSDTISRQAAIEAAALSAAEWDGMYVQDINGRIRKALEKLPSAQPEAPCYLGSPCEYQNPNAEIQEECKLDGTTAVAKSKRTFVELLVHYPHPDVCTYPEYKGKPYYSIKYIEDGECFVGFGTYKPEVLSQYLRDYFMPSAQPEERTEERTETHACDLIGKIQFGIEATDADDVYSCGMRNGMRWCMSLIDDKEPKYENCPPAPPYYVTGFWLIRKWGDDAKCSNCGKTFKDVYDMDSHDAFCRCCGAKMEGLKVIK